MMANTQGSNEAPQDRVARSAIEGPSHFINIHTLLAFHEFDGILQLSE